MINLTVSAQVVVLFEDSPTQEDLRGDIGIRAPTKIAPEWLLDDARVATAALALKLSACVGQPLGDDGEGRRIDR